MPFTGTDEIHMRAPTCKYADSKSGFNDMVGIEIRYRQGNLAVFFIEVTEGAEVVSRSGMEMNVRSPVFSYRHPERSRGIFAIRGQGFTRSPHVPRTSPLFSSVFHPARTLSGSLRSPPSPWGKAYDTGYAFLSFVFMPVRVLLLLAIPQSRFPVCKEDFSLRSK